MSFDALTRALQPLLGRRDRRAIFDGRRWLREHGDPAELLERHLRGELLLGPVHGGEATTELIAWDIDGGSHEGSFDAAGAVRVLLDVIQLAGLAPPMLATSKSGTGFHVYVLFAGPVDTVTAAALARALKDRVGRPEIDRAYPSGSEGDGLVLALPGCGLFGPHPLWLGAAGSRLCHSVSLEPFSADAHAEVLAGWPRSSTATMERAAKQFAKPHAVAPAAPLRPQWHRPLPVYRSELDDLADNCEFVRYCADFASSMTYEQWFSLATVLAVFPGGRQLFDAISATDPERYRARDVERKLSSIRGGPRHCDNLGWHCPKRAECGSLGVRSPAGLPYKLKRARRKGAA